MALNIGTFESSRFGHQKDVFRHHIKRRKARRERIGKRIEKYKNGNFCDVRNQETDAGFNIENE